MQRVRTTMNSASQSAGKSQLPHIDVHTGEVSTSPSAVSYFPYYPYADLAWNGEGFNFNREPGYWLAAVSGFQHGIGSDRLGGGGKDYQGWVALSAYEQCISHVVCS